MPSTTQNQQFNPFLSLAPTTSESYPQTPSSRAGQPTTATRPAQRRSSSVSSTGSAYRVLKLGPVHWGEHPDEHKEDFSELSSSP